MLSRSKSVRSNRAGSLLINPKVPPWEVVFDQHLKQCLNAATNRDFTYFRLTAALSAKPEFEKMNHKAAFLSIIHDETPIHQLEDLNKSRCQVAVTGFKEYIREIEGTKGEQLDWLAWGRLLDSEEERVMNMIVCFIYH